MEKKILFYDGDCGFCNKSVQLVLNNEQGPEIHFSALQSEFAQHFFEEHQFEKPDLSTFYFWDGNRLYQKSSGALRILNYLKFRWKFLKVGYVLPAFLRDKMYDFIAKRRHKLSAGFCMLPDVEQRKRFLK